MSERARDDLMQAAEPRTESGAARLRMSARGQQIVHLMAAAGSQITNSIGERLGNSELAGNVPILVLCELALQGPLRPRDLLEVTHVTSGGLTKQLDELERLGLIKRAFGTLKQDRRASVIDLTPEGARVAGSIGAAIEDRLDEIRVLMDGISRLLDEQGSPAGQP